MKVPRMEVDSPRMEVNMMLMVAIKKKHNRERSGFLGKRNTDRKRVESARGVEYVGRNVFHS